MDNYCEDNQYLLLAIDTEAELVEQKDPVDEKLSTLQH